MNCLFQNIHWILCSVCSTPSLTRPLPHYTAAHSPLHTSHILPFSPTDSHTATHDAHGLPTDFVGIVAAHDAYGLPPDFVGIESVGATRGFVWESGGATHGSVWEGPHQCERCVAKQRSSRAFAYDYHLEAWLCWHCFKVTTRREPAESSEVLMTKKLGTKRAEKRF